MTKARTHLRFLVGAALVVGSAGLVTACVPDTMTRTTTERTQQTTVPMMVPPPPIVGQTTTTTTTEQTQP